MRVFRIEREKFLQQTLSGVGASMASGFRWNSKTTRMVYTAESRALAMLEVAVHIDFHEDLPKDRFFVEIEIPDDLPILEISTKKLPKNWDSKPPSSGSQKAGDQFVLRNEYAVMRVPSAIIPLEYNYLINPLHADARRIKVVSKTALTIDERLKTPSSKR